MKTHRQFIHATALLLISTGFVGARPIQLWPYQELVDKSDLIVIAKPVSTHDTPERTVSLAAGQSFGDWAFLGLSTEFDVSLVIKGDKSLKTIVLHHFRFEKTDEHVVLMDGPGLVSFDPAKMKSWLLFLKKEADGRFAPVNGQIDPNLYAVKAADSIDLVVVAKAISAKKQVDETTMTNMSPPVHLLGYETEFAVQEVLKGSQAAKNLVLHHYERTGEDFLGETSTNWVWNEFKPGSDRLYLLMLKKEADGRFTPIPEGGWGTLGWGFPVSRFGTVRQ